MKELIDATYGYWPKLEIEAMHIREKIDCGSHDNDESTEAELVQGDSIDDFYIEFSTQEISYYPLTLHYLIR